MGVASKQHSIVLDSSMHTLCVKQRHREKQMAEEGKEKEERTDLHGVAE